MAFIAEIGIAFQLILQRAVDLLAQSFSNSETFWILLPLLVTLFLMEIYFRRYSEETLGWESAIGNSLVLFFVAMSLFSYLDRNNLLLGASVIPKELFSIALTKSLITFFIIFESVLLMVLNFFRLMPKNIAFGISSTLIINFVSIMCLLLVYSNVPLDIATIMAILLLFVIIAILLNLLLLLIPELKLKVPKAPEKEEKKEKNKFK